MPSKTCTHIKVTGVRCNSPALRGEQFCYFHQRMHRGVRTPPQARLHPIALIEDEESIQTALMEVINALMRNTIDLKRASLILRALHIAVKNASRVKIDAHASSVVTEIPNYAMPENAQVGMETNHVETAAFGRPAMPALSAVEGAKPSTPTTDLDDDPFRPTSELDIPTSAQPEPESHYWRTLIEPPPILTAAERAQKRAELEAAIAECGNEPYQAMQSSAGVLAGCLAGDPPTTQMAPGRAPATHVGTGTVGTGTPARASGPEVPGRSTTAINSPTPIVNKPNGKGTNAQGANGKDKLGITTNGKGTSSMFQPALSASKRSAEKSNGANHSANQAPSAAEGHHRIPASTPVRKKPPLAVKQTPAPKGQKNAAHSASCG